MFSKGHELYNIETGFNYHFNAAVYPLIVQTLKSEMPRKYSIFCAVTQHIVRPMDKYCIWSKWEYIYCEQYYLPNNFSLYYVHL